jgi:hypothetical protein
LYNSSVYRKENELFELLGGKKQKPNEGPIDIIFQVIFFAFAFLSVILILTIMGATFFSQLATMAESPIPGLEYILIVLFVAGFGLEFFWFVYMSILLSRGRARFGLS